MAHLPIGIQTFRDIRNNDYLYVDKTGIIAEMVLPGKGMYFLTRPRRFGKSLLVSTLESVFRGEHEVFEGLAIAETGYAFPEHPVLVFDFSVIPHGGAEELLEGLLLKIDQMAEENEVALRPGTPLQTRFEELIKALAKKRNVVILVDEYDKPIVEHIRDSETAEACRDVLRSFFGVIKGSDSLLRFVFITGITRFSKISLFSEMNNLVDISIEDPYASLLGLTEEEIDRYLTGRIIAWGAKTGRPASALRSELRKMYNGYRFSEVEAWVYNPWSILNAVQGEKLRNYWFGSGSPRFLMNLLEKRLREPGAFSIGTLYDLRMRADQLPSFDVRNLSLEGILMQAGYLTVKAVSGRTLHLGFPNREVEESLLHAIVSYLTINEEFRAFDVVEQLRAALFRADLEQFFEIMRTRLLANIPYDIQIPHHRYFQTVLHTTLLLAGIDSRPEERTNIGRIDQVVETDDTVFVFELKMDQTAEGALEQIRAKDYGQKYSGSGKKVIGVGVAIADRNIAEWSAIELANGS